MGLMAELFERGMAVRSAVPGRAHVERARQRTTKFTEDWQTFITQYAWGGIWTRPGLERKTRSMVTHRHSRRAGPGEASPPRHRQYRGEPRGGEGDPDA